MKLKTTLSVLLIFFSAGLYAQSGFTFNGQIRPRFELNNKDFNSNTSAYTYTYLRTRIGVKFAPSENVSGFVQFQDSRIFGQEPSTMTNNANVDVHQAYFTVNKLFDLPLSLKAGRMEVVYGNERFLGAVGWHNISRSFDGAIVGIDIKFIHADFLALQEKETLLYGDSLDQSVVGAYFDILPESKTKIQPFWIYQIQNKSDKLSRSTIGIYIKGNLAGIWHEIEAAYQLGTIFTSSAKDVSAYMFAINLGYKFDSKLKPSISAGFEYLSGDDGSDPGKYKVFNTLYATNHKFYGYMDYFVNIPKDTYGLGLMDIHAKLGAVLSRKVNAGLNLHMFNSAADYTLLNGSASNGFGTEADLTLKYLFNKKTTFVLGESLFAPGDIFKETKFGDTASWGYLMAVVNL